MNIIVLETDRERKSFLCQISVPPSSFNCTMTLEQIRMANSTASLYCDAETTDLIQPIEKPLLFKL